MSTTYAYGRFETDEEFKAFQRKLETRFHIAATVRYFYDGVAGQYGLNQALATAKRDGKRLIFRDFSDAGRDTISAVANILSVMNKGVPVVILDTNFDNFPEEVSQHIFRQTMEAILRASIRHTQINRKLGVEAAKLAGAIQGRPRKFKPAKMMSLIDEMALSSSRRLTSRKVAVKIGCSKSTAASLLRSWRENKKRQKPNATSTT
jgi:DNA invertase Pin-like site-specific DNA recombinase